MSVDCQGLLLGKISTEDIANVIKQNLGCGVTINKSDEESVMYCSEDKTNYIISNYINFTYKDEERSLHVFYDSIQHDIKNYKDYVDTTKEYTQISLGHWGSDKEIMEEIIKEFGGYIDYNDCDDEYYVQIAQDKNNSIKPVIHITMEELYEKYGAIVVIDK